MLKLKGISLVLLLLIFPLIGQARFVFVGNGGEGVKEGEQLFTRDLYEYDRHKNPYFGSWKRPKIADLLAEKVPLNLNAQQQSFLVRKLSDLDSVLPGLGPGLLKAIQFYDWRFVSHDLALPTQPDELRADITPDRRVVIANRYMASIIVNEAAFQRLDDANKVALILHEAVYALLPARRTKDGNKSEQEISMARLLTAEFFMQERLHSLEFRERVMDQFGFFAFLDSRDELAPSTIASERTLRLQSTEVRMDILESTLSPAAVKGHVTNFCARVFKFSTQSRVIKLARTPFFNLKSVIYTNVNGTAQYKLQFEFETVMASPYQVEESDCVVKTRQKIDFLFSQPAVDYQRGLFSFGTHTFHGMNNFYCRYESSRHVAKVWGEEWRTHLAETSVLPSNMLYAGICGPYQGVHNIDGILAYTFKRGYSCWFKTREVALRMAGVRHPERLILKKAVDVPFFFRPNDNNLCR